jgi:hypothetical protein
MWKKEGREKAKGDGEMTFRYPMTGGREDRERERERRRRREKARRPKGEEEKGGMIWTSLMSWMQEREGRREGEEGEGRRERGRKEGCSYPILGRRFIRFGVKCLHSPSIMWQLVRRKNHDFLVS